VSAAAAYSASAAAWALGPARIYDGLAAQVVARAGDLRNAVVLDVGSGTGAAAVASGRAGARRTVSVDSALGMLRFDAARRGPAVGGNALSLPFAAGSFDVSIAAFALNHLTDPAGALAEMARVTAPAGVLVASAYAATDAHPVKAAVQSALRDRGWSAEPWYMEVRDHALPLLATVEGARAVAAAAGVRATVEVLEIPFPDLTPADLVAWRLGMAHHAPFVAALGDDARAALLADVLARLGEDVPTLVRSIVVLAARVPTAR
jgi:SAM-dependent methyltransferase